MFFLIQWCFLFLLGGVIRLNILCCHYRLRSLFFFFFLQPYHPYFSFTKQYVLADADKWTERHNLCADKSVTEFAISSVYLSLQSKVARVVSVFCFFAVVVFCNPALWGDCAELWEEVQSVTCKCAICETQSSLITHLWIFLLVEIRITSYLACFIQSYEDYWNSIRSC